MDLVQVSWWEDKYLLRQPLEKSNSVFVIEEEIWKLKSFEVEDFNVNQDPKCCQVNKGQYYKRIGVLIFEFAAPWVKVYLVSGKRCMAKAKTAVARRTLDPLYQQQLVFHEKYSGCVLQVRPIL